jgi:hypothetical protein
MQNSKNMKLRSQVIIRKQPTPAKRMHTGSLCIPSTTKMTFAMCTYLVMLLSSTVGLQKYSLLVYSEYICDSDLGDCHVSCGRHCNNSAIEKNVNSNGEGLPGK